jgi:hypothetical protein
MPAAKTKTKAGGRAAAEARDEALDFSALPAAAVVGHTRSLCLACIFGLFTEQMGLAPRTAYTEIRRYAPTPAELMARDPQPLLQAGGRAELALPLLRRRETLARATRPLPHRGRQADRRRAPRPRQETPDEGRPVRRLRREEDGARGLLRLAGTARAGVGL